MKEETILRGNEGIASFMGAELVNDAPEEYPNGYWMSSEECELPSYQSKDFCFHESWDWLMPVVEKIEKGDHYFIITRDICEIYELTNNSKPIIKVCASPKIEAVWKAIVSFIN